MPNPKDDSEASPLSVAQALADLDPSAFAMPAVVGPEDDPDAPRLPLSDDEPPPVSSLDARLLAPDANVLRKFDTHKRARQALTAALAGQPYDASALPDSRALLLGLMRALVQNGIETHALVNAVLEAANE